MVSIILDLEALGMAPWSQLSSDNVASDQYRLGKTDFLVMWDPRLEELGKAPRFLDSSDWLVYVAP